MKRLRLILTLWAIAIFACLMLCISQAKAQAEEEIPIPPEAHEKAIAALKALGPDRGTKKINYRMVTIVGITKGIEAKSTALQATLKDLGAKETETEITIDLPGDILFDFDQWSIRPDAEETLRKIGDIISAYKSPKVVIGGHTDAKGSEEYNRELSEKRAEAVKKWLSEHTEVQPELMEAIGYGETKPVAPNTNPDGTDNPEGRQKNRRVEIVIRKK